MFCPDMLVTGKSVTGREVFGIIEWLEPTVHGTLAHIRESDPSDVRQVIKVARLSDIAEV